jgi:hypothetical protein
MMCGAQRRRTGHGWRSASQCRRRCSPAPSAAGTAARICRTERPRRSVAVRCLRLPGNARRDGTCPPRSGSAPRCSAEDIGSRGGDFCAPPGSPLMRTQNRSLRVNGTIFRIGRRGLSGRPLLVSFAPSDRPSSVPSRSSTLSATSSDRRCIAMRSKRPLVPRAVAREAIATMDCYLQYWRNNRTKWDSSLQEGTWFFHFTSACSDGSPN